MTILLTIIYFFHARVQEIDQLYCECLMKQFHSIAQGHSKKNPERELAQPTEFEIRGTRRIRRGKRVIQQKWNILD